LRANLRAFQDCDPGLARQLRAAGTAHTAWTDANPFSVLIRRATATRRCDSIEFACEPTPEEFRWLTRQSTSRTTTESSKGNRIPGRWERFLHSHTSLRNSNVRIKPGGTKIQCVIGAGVIPVTSSPRGLRRSGNGDFFTSMPFLASDLPPSYKGRGILTAGRSPRRSLWRQGPGARVACGAFSQPINSRPPKRQYATKCIMPSGSSLPLFFCFESVVFRHECHYIEAHQKARRFS